MWARRQYDDWSEEAARLKKMDRKKTAGDAFKTVTEEKNKMEAATNAFQGYSMLNIWKYWK